MMTSAQVVETSVNTNNSPSQDYTTNPDDHSNHNTNKFETWKYAQLDTLKHFCKFNLAQYLQTNSCKLN